VVASKRRVEQTLRELIARAGSVQDSLAGSLPEPRVLALHLTDLETDYWTELDGGKMGTLHPGRPEDAHIRIRVASDDLIELVEGEMSLIPAYLTGRLRIEASATDLMAVRRLLR
jgi:putative sterol carrier protein